MSALGGPQAKRVFNQIFCLKIKYFFFHMNLNPIYFLLVKTKKCHGKFISVIFEEQEMQM